MSVPPARRRRRHLLQPGVTVNTSPTNFDAITQVRMERFDGERFKPFGPVLSGTVS